MTVKELIERLQDFKPELEVVRQEFDNLGYDIGRSTINELIYDQETNELVLE